MTYQGDPTIPMQFPEHSGCKLCPLWQQARSVGIPTRLADGALFNAHPQAVLVIGQSPGPQEDFHHKSWIGPAGKLLHGMLDLAEIGKHADIYLTNACRCKPPQDTAPTPGQYHACCIHWLTDLRLLLDFYPGAVTVLLAGGVAAQAYCGESLHHALMLKGRLVQPAEPRKLAKTAPIIGPRPMAQLDGSLRALKIKLAPDTLKKLDAIFPGPGGRAPEAYAW